MLVVLVLVFIAVFVVAVLILTASRMGTSQQTERTLSTLYAALATSKPDSPDQIVDIRKQELLSTVPLLNRWLLKIDVAPNLRMLLYQAGLKWTVGSLLALCIACFAVPAYLIYLRTGAAFFSILIGLALSSIPFIYVMQKRTARFNKFEQGLPPRPLTSWSAPCAPDTASSPRSTSPPARRPTPSAKSSASPSTSKTTDSS